MKKEKQVSSEVAIITRLEEAGFEVYMVGGCVRDELLGIPVNDIDITTSATPDEIALLFAEESIDFIGKQFGVMMVNGVEVATFRKETYEVVGKPTVNLQASFQEDVLRRDFTINAMGKKLSGSIIDYVGGQEDIKKKQIKAVGEPLERFLEDPSRIVRGVYLASALGFSIEENTKRVMTENGFLLKQVPVELIGKIVKKVIDRNCLSSFTQSMKDLNLLSYVFPYLIHTVDLPQNPKYHDSCVFDHIIRVIKSAESRFPRNKVMLLTALFHDVAKGMPGVRGVNKVGQINDLNHEEMGVPITKEALQQLQFGKDVVEPVLFLTEWHGIRLPEKPNRRTVTRTIRKFIPHFSDKESLMDGIELLFDFMLCDMDGFGPELKNQLDSLNEKWRMAFSKVLADTMFYRAELPVDGRLIQSYGFSGKDIGAVFDKLLMLKLQEREEIESFLLKNKY